MVPAIYPQVDESPETFHLVASTLQSLTSRLTIAGLNGEDAVLNLCIVGTQHHFRHIGNELTPFTSRVIESEVVGSPDRRLASNHFFDLRAHIRQEATKLQRRLSGMPIVR